MTIAMLHNKVTAVTSYSQLPELGGVYFESEFKIFQGRGVRSLIFLTTTPLLCFKNWPLLVVLWLLITQTLSTPAPV